MALFSRRGRRADHTLRPLERVVDASVPEATAPEATAVDAAAPDSVAPAPADALPAQSEVLSDEPPPDVAASEREVAPAGDEPAPQVTISVTSFDDGAAPRPLRPAATAPEQTEAMPGMPDNRLLQIALAGLPEKPQPADVMNVMRQALQGRLYVRAQGDAQSQLAEGRGLSLAITTHQDKRFLLAFSGGTQMQASASAEGTGATSAIGQASPSILRMAVDSGYDGVYLDHADAGARLVLPIELVRKSLDEGVPPFELKALLAGPRTDATAAQIADVLTRTRVWVAGGADAQGRMGLAEARTADGTRRLEVYSHPLELLALGRGDRALPLTPEQLRRALASDAALAGIILDGAGPWIEIDRGDLAPLLDG